MYLALNGMQENYKNVVVTVSLPSQVDDKQVIFNHVDWGWYEKEGEG